VPRSDYDLVVIGVGIAGMAAAMTAIGLGKKVALVERAQLGGNCASLTCIPSKALVRAGHAMSQLHTLKDFGIQIDSDQKNSDGVMARIRSVVEEIAQKDSPETFEAIGVRVIQGEAAFLDNRRIKVNGQEISAEKCIIATGTRPLIPPIEGLNTIPYLTNETVYQIDKLPESLIILGGGIDGLEFASAFGHLGVAVTVVEMAPQLLGTMDRELADELLEQLKKNNVRILSGTKALTFSKEKNNIILTIQSDESHYGEVQAEAVLLTIGRKANLEPLALENAGVNVNPKGIIADDRLRTSASNIYACGDIVGPYQLAHTAEYQGIVAGTNAILPIKRKVNYRNMASVIFTEPPLASVGLTEHQAREQQHGKNIRIYRFNYQTMRRAIVDGSVTGSAKFICDNKGRLLGAHILGEAAGEVIHEAQVIRALNQPLRKLHSVTHSYPTYAQALVGRASQLAYLDFMANNQFVKLGLRFLPGYANRLSLVRDRLAEVDQTVPASEQTKTVFETGMEKKMLPVEAIEMGPQACVLLIGPELTDENEERYITACIKRATTEIPSIVLDFGRLQHMNGLGASMLVKMAARLREKGIRLKAYAVSDHYRNVFMVTGLEQVIDVYESRKDALLSIGVQDKEPQASAARTEVSPVDNKYWARPISKLHVPFPSPQARNLNVDGRRVVGPVNGFGQLWQKTYKLRINNTSITPEQTISVLKQQFPSFQPSFNHFYPSKNGIQPGEIILIDSSTPGGPVSTGVMVVYADDLSFTFITPQGHPESGWVTFSAYKDNDILTVQIVGLARANDPVYEAAFRVVGSGMQVKIWTYLLTSLASYLNVPPDITIEPIIVDRTLQWSEAGNIWYNAQLRTLLHVPFGLITRPLKTRKRPEVYDR